MRKKSTDGWDERRLSGGESGFPRPTGLLRVDEPEDPHGVSSASLADPPSGVFTAASHTSTVSPSPSLDSSGCQGREMAEIGVAMSGGGHRAALFGLGVLLY